MPEPRSEQSVEPQTQRETTPLAQMAEKQPGAHGGIAEHGGAYTTFRELVAASGGQEPPPEKFSPLFRRSQWSHPVNDGQRARLLGALQQQYGNRYVQRVLSPNSSSRSPLNSPSNALILRHEKHAGSATDMPNGFSMPSQIEASSSQPLDNRTQNFMESRFGRDFNNVRVHDDSQAHQAAKGLDAEAFTTGRDIYFSPGTYNPSTETGQRLLAHELTHVVQQEQGATGTRPYNFSVSQPGDALERQADAASDAVMRGEMFAPITSSTSRSIISRQAAGAGGGGAAPARPATGGSAGVARPAATGRPGDFPIMWAGTTVMLPTADLIDRAAPGGRLAVPERYLKYLAVPGFKATEASLDFDENKQPKSATIGVALTIPQLEGTGSLTVDKGGNASGTAHVTFSSRKIPGLKDTTVDARISKDDFAFDATITFDLPKVTGSLNYKYQNKKHSGKGMAKYEGAKLQGSIEIIMSEAGKISGSGMLDMELFKGLRGQIEVAVNEKRDVQVKGKLSVPGQIELFPEKKIEKNFFSFEKKFPLWGIVIPVVDINVGLFAEIHAGAGFRAKFGPGVLRDIALTGEFGTDPEAATEFGLSGEFFVPAGAEIVIKAGGGIGLGLAVADITGGIEAIGVAGLYTALSVRPQFQYAGGKYTISGMAELAGVAQAKFGINAFAKIDVGVWIFKGTVWRKDWKLAEWIWNLGLNVALKANISYTLGEDFAPDINFETGQVDPEKLVRDVMPESGSPVPAPPKPPVPDKGGLTAQGATGKQAPGAAPAKAPTPPTPASPPARTQPGGAGAPSAGPAVATHGAESPEHTKQVHAGLAAIDDEERSFQAQGKYTKVDAEKIAAKVKKTHSVFKSLTVVDGGNSWDFDYVASPGKKKKGLTKKEATKELEKYDATLNSAGKIMGTFGKFDWAGYDAFTTAVPPIHPANIEYKHPQGPAIPKPSGSYTIEGGTKGGPNTRDWIDNKVGKTRDGKKRELETEAAKYATADEKKQKVLEYMNVGSDPEWLAKKGRSVAQLIEWLGQLHVERTYNTGMSYPDINLRDWEEHHIQPVSFKGSDANSNLIFLRHSEHHPITTWWRRHQTILETALKS